MKKIFFKNKVNSIQLTLNSQAELTNFAIVIPVLLSFITYYLLHKLSIDLMTIALLTISVITYYTLLLLMKKMTYEREINFKKDRMVEIDFFKALDGVMIKGCKWNHSNLKRIEGLSTTQKVGGTFNCHLTFKAKSSKREFSALKDRVTVRMEDRDGSMIGIPLSVSNLERLIELIGPGRIKNALNKRGFYS